MENFYNTVRNFKLPQKKEINLVINSFSKKENILFIILTITFILSGLLIFKKINQYFMVEIPLRGGTISEGIIGSPRFVNPILASSRADEDLVALIYSGLMRKTINGDLILDLAEKYTKSENGLTYIFTLKDNVYFQDGKPLTISDIIFTISKIKDGTLKNSQKTKWDGINISKIDEKNIQFNLKEPYASFLENTTIGIMPEHLWNNSPIELNNTNTNPIGSGPYMIEEINKQSSGAIDSYKLKSFNKFILGEPYIKNLNLYFYSNEDDLIKALRDGKIDQISSITPVNAEKLKNENYKIKSLILGRVFGLFFNQNVNNIFLDKTVLKAIDETINKERIINEVFLQYGKVINYPIPLNLKEYRKTKIENNTPREEIIKKVYTDLAKAGWTKGEDGFLEKIKTVNKKKNITKLEFSISTLNIEELVKTALFIKEDLEKIGIKVEIKSFETGNLNQNVIRPRKYDALLFGEIINKEEDLFAFWHSSQRLDPGLNVAMYTNPKVDKILEDAFIAINNESRINKYLEFEKEIKKDLPAIFLYSPSFIYVISKNLKQFETEYINSPSDRYLDVYLWYSEVENVWKIFKK